MAHVKSNQTLTTMLLAFTFGVVMLDRMVQLFLGPYLVTAFNLTPVQVGLMASVMAICWGLSSFVFGLVSDRIGRKRVLVPAVIIFSLLSCLSGLARNYEELLIIRGLLGLAEGPCWSVIMALAEESSSSERRGRNIGIVNSAGPLVGSAIAPIFATQIAAMFGWREAFFFAAVPGLILAVLVMIFIPEPQSARATASHKSLLLSDLKAIVRVPTLWACFLGAFVLATWIFSVSVFGPLYMTQVAGQSATNAGFIMGGAGVGGFLLALLWPTISDKIGRKPVLIFLGVLACFHPLLILFTPLYSNLWVMAGLMAVTMSGSAIASLLMILIPSETVSASLRATAIGFASIGAEVLGATLSPTIGGLMAQKYGLQAPMWLSFSGAVVIIAIGLLIRETAKSKRKGVTGSDTVSNVTH